MAPSIPACGALWAEWGMSCEIERGHPGAHLSASGTGGKVGAWGNGVEHWERVAVATPTAQPLHLGAAGGGRGVATSPGQPD